jgi:hypothetical protein
MVAYLAALFGLKTLRLEFQTSSLVRNKLYGVSYGAFA